MRYFTAKKVLWATSGPHIRFYTPCPSLNRFTLPPSYDESNQVPRPSTHVSACRACLHEVEPNPQRQPRDHPDSVHAAGTGTMARLEKCSTKPEVTSLGNPTKQSREGAHLRGLFAVKEPCLLPS